MRRGELSRQPLPPTPLHGTGPPLNRSSSARLSPLALSPPRPASSSSTLRPSTTLVPSLLALAPVCPGNINQLTTHLEFSCLVSRDTRPRLPPLVPLLVVPDQEKQLMIVTTAVNKILLRIL